VVGRRSPATRLVNRAKWPDRPGRFAVPGAARRRGFLPTGPVRRDLCPSLGWRLGCRI